MFLDSCFLCGAAGKVVASNLPFRLYRCVACTFVWSDLDRHRVQDLYRGSYYDAWGITADAGTMQVVRRMKRAGFRRYLEMLRKYLPFAPGQRLLDVGCATGFLLEEARDQGHEVYGVEPSPYAAGVAQHEFGERVVCGFLKDAGFAPNSFDVVTMTDVIEHMPDPRRELSLVRSLLKEGGLLLLVTPNIAGLSARIFGSRWINIKEEHLWYFDKSTLRAFLGPHFQVMEVRLATKSLCLQYLMTQFRVFHVPVVSAWAPPIIARLPARLRNMVFPLRSGDLIAIAKASRTQPS